MPDFFALYGLPQSFHPDTTSVRKQYYTLSRQHHPDRFAGADEPAYAEALRMSAINNEAYRTLSDPDQTMGYILKFYDVVEEEEAYKLPPEFLMEMMDLNEAIDDGADGASSSWQEAMNSWETEARPFMQRFEGGERSKELFADLKDYYYRKKYLLRIKARL